MQNSLLRISDQLTSSPLDQYPPVTIAPVDEVVKFTMCNLLICHLTNVVIIFQCTIGSIHLDRIGRKC